MAVFSKIMAAAAVMYPLIAEPVLAGSIADIEHVVLFMQENRAFDHYFGTLAGVRGFSDPNVQVNADGKTVWEQEVNSALTTNASYLLPWYVNYEGGDYLNATQCMVAGDNGWQDNHAALNGGLNNHWATNNTPWSWSYFKRDDIPVQFAIADGWTVGDMYQEGVIASTNPNRVTWASGSINAPGSQQNNPADGGWPYIDNNETPGCETGGFNCYPLRWETAAEIYEANNVSWSLFQDADNFDDNPLAWFAQYQTAPKDSPLYQKGFVGQTLDDFYARAANGTLPAISYIIGPTELSEHPPYSPRDGAWLEKQVVDAVTHGAHYDKSVLIISWDETGGLGDHVTPYHSPNGTQGEWLEDPYGEVGYTYTGPGFRLPFYIISPFTRNGGVFTEHADHNSQLLFVEEWLAAKGVNVTTNQMSPWRRAHMSTLVNMFDFENPDYSVPELPYAIPPHVNAAGVYDGAEYCEATYPNTRPGVPYGNQVAPNEVHTYSEQGFKPMRGQLTEGRYVVFEFGGYALTNPGSPAKDFTGTKATINHESINQRWVVHSLVDNGSQSLTNTFTITSALDGRYIADHTSLSTSASGAETYTIIFAASRGYALQKENGKYLTIDSTGTVQITSEKAYFKAYSVTYSS